MVDALRVVADGGWEGVRHNHLTNALLTDFEQSVPKNAWRIGNPKPFTAIELENYFVLAWRDGLILRDGYKETEYGPSYSGEFETIAITLSGWRFLEQNDAPTLKRWARQVSENVPTIIVSVIGAVFARSLLKWMGIIQ